MIDGNVQRALAGRVEELARDVGVLRRRFASNGDAWTGGYLADRIADTVEDVHAMLHPTAAELVACTYPGDAATIDAAIDVVDARAGRLRKLLQRAAA